MAQSSSQGVLLPISEEKGLGTRLGTALWQPYRFLSSLNKTYSCLYLVNPTVMKATVLKSSLVSSALGIVHPNLSSPLTISRGRVRGHSFSQLQLPTNNRRFVYIEAVIADSPPLAIVQEFHASLGRGIEPHEFDVRNTADNLVGLTRAVNDARILEKMFAFGTFRTVVRLVDAVRAVFRAI